MRNKFVVAFHDTINGILRQTGELELAFFGEVLKSASAGLRMDNFDAETVRSADIIAQALSVFAPSSTLDDNPFMRTHEIARQFDMLVEPRHYS